MGKIRFEGSEMAIEDGAKILETCDDLGVPFGCQDGLCGTCIVTIVSGGNNLEPKNDKEEAMGLRDNERLACQCVLREGDVEVAL